MKDHEDKKKETGTGAGAATGAAVGGVATGVTTGVLAGGVTGPVGAVVGAVVGAAVGAVAGHGAASESESHDHSAAGGSSAVHTVLGVFDTHAAAQLAHGRLVEAGFQRDAMHMQLRRSDGQAGDDDDGFFSHLFGTGDHADTNGRQHPHTVHAQTYGEAVRRGKTVLMVDTHGEAEADRASRLMHEAGAIDVDEQARQWHAQAGQQPATGSVGQRGEKLEVVQEELQVGKREEQRGGVRVVQRLSEKPVREVVRLREERAVVDRQPVNRPASPQDLNAFREGSMEIHERKEVPVVAKSARVVEEVAVGKQVREREETIEDTVRRKDVDVERIGGGAHRDERAFAADAERERLQREEQLRGGRPGVDPGKPR